MKDYPTIYKTINYSKTHKALVLSNEKDKVNIQVVYLKSDGKTGEINAMKDFWKHYEKLRVNNSISKCGEI